MIGYVKGKLLSHYNETAIVENNGIGYEITCSKEMLDLLIKRGEGEVWTYLAVREDGVSLYGFISPEEKNMFLKLITVSGIGPKMGITVLSNMELNELALKIATQDVKGLSQIKGLGKKTAERIILELREKVALEGVEEVKSEKKEEVKISKEGEDAIIALMSLGFKKGECLPVVTEAIESGLKSVQEIVTYSLKHIK